MIRIPVLDAAQAASWDERARADHSIPSRVLMEVAGRACAGVIAREFRERLPDGVIVVCGTGNNGGDGWVAGRALRSVGVKVWGVRAGDPRTPDCKANQKLALGEGVELLQTGDTWPAAGLLVDALLGTGASGPLHGAIAELAQRIVDHGGPIAAVDGPTGVDLSTGEKSGSVIADLTVTFGGLRRGHLLARDRCGRVVVVDIGFPPPPGDASWPTFVHDHWASELLPTFTVSMHKGQRGKVTVIGGASGMSGAALHSVQAAFTAGAGLVKLAASADTVRAAQASLPDVMTVSSNLGPNLEDEVLEVIQWADAVVLGPGLGRSEEREKFVTAVLAACNVPVIVDADGLRAGREAFQAADEVVLTPHLGEFEAMFPELSERASKDPFEAAAQASALAASTVLLKGVPTIVADSGEARFAVGSGNPALATGGSGDVLSGFIGAIVARRLEPPVAAALAAHVLGRAADIAAAERSVRATRPADVMESVSEVLRWWSEPPKYQPPILLELDQPPTQW